MSLPVYSRADLSRTVALVVALSWTAFSTGAAAREFRAAEISSEHVNRSNVAVARVGTAIPARHVLVDTASVSHRATSAKDYTGVGFEAAMAGIHAKAQRDSAAVLLVEPIRKME